jgi:hypothetical protein
MDLGLGLGLNRTDPESIIKEKNIYILCRGAEEAQ